MPEANVLAVIAMFASASYVAHTDTKYDTSRRQMQVPGEERPKGVSTW